MRRVAYGTGRAWVAPAEGIKSAMTWYPTDMRPREPSVLLKTWRKMSATVRWVILIAVAGLMLAAVIGLGVTSLVTLIQDGQ